MADINIKGAIIPSEDAWIYDYFGIENTNPASVCKAIKDANGERLDVYINSGGGDIFAGSEIYESLRSYKGDVMIHVVGLAASAASVIACARKSEIAPTAMIMVHNVSGSAGGDYHDMDKTSDVLKQANRTIASAYMDKAGMIEADALALMDAETWLTAQDAVAKGLVDRVSQPQCAQLVASYGSGVLPSSVIQKMKNELNPHCRKASADFLCSKKQMQAKLDLLKIGGKIYD